MAPAALAIGKFAIGALSVGASLMGQVQANRAQSAMYQQNAANARAAQNAQAHSIETNLRQERAGAIQDQFENSIEAAKARGTANAAAGERNTSGLSVDALLADYYGKEGRYNSAVQTNYSYAAQSAADQMEGLHATTQNQINSVPRPTAPSYLGAALRVASLGLDAFGDYRQNNLTQKSYTKSGY